MCTRAPSVGVIGRRSSATGAPSHCNTTKHLFSSSRTCRQRPAAARNGAGGFGVSSLATETRKRVRRDPDTTRGLILDTTEKLMVEEGYAAVSSRRVAQELGLS